MKTTCFVLLLSFVLVEALSSQVLYDLFLDKPPKKIKEVRSVSHFFEGDSVVSENEYFAFFNENGQLEKESIPSYHVQISYKYDDARRVIEKEELFGESFGNATTTYNYKKNEVIEEQIAMGFYSKTYKKLDEKQNITNESVYFVAAGLGESNVATSEYTYKSNLLKEIKTDITYYDYKLEIGEIEENKVDVMLTALKQSKKVNTEQVIQQFIYNKEGLLEKEIKIAIKGGQETEVYEMKRSYNQKNNTTKVTWLGGKQIQTYHNGLLKSEVSGKENQTKIEFNYSFYK